MATTKETLKTFRERFNAEVSGGIEDEAMACFDRALASVLMDQLDGNPAPEKPKRVYTRKPKTPSTPPTE